jgi:uracil DNA glycosylase
MFAWLQNFASMAIITAPEYKIWSINGLSTFNNRYVDEKLGTHSHRSNCYEILINNILIIV